MNPAIALWLWWLMWGILTVPQCTRCGGDHSLSKCPWPAEKNGRG
jgi:hypothetical protein